MHNPSNKSCPKYAAASSNEPCACDPKWRPFDQSGMVYAGTVLKTVHSDGPEVSREVRTISAGTIIKTGPSTFEVVASKVDCENFRIATGVSEEVAGAIETATRNLLHGFLEVFDVQVEIYEE